MDCSANYLAGEPLPEDRNVQLCISSGEMSADEDYSYYCKILVSNQLAGIIIGSAGHEIRSLKSNTGAKIVLSPHGMYFPGTTERIAALEGSEQAVLQVLDWILGKIADHKLMMRLQQEEEAAALGEEIDESMLAADKPSLWTSRLTCVRICVPRAVVGSVIGKNGGYIQSLRVATGASINISPLFVTANEACAERIVSVESRKKHSLRTAAFTLIRKINSHPDKSSCKHVCYYRKLSFDSPLAEPVLSAHRKGTTVMQQLTHEEQGISQHQTLEQEGLVFSTGSSTRTVSQVLGCTRGIRGLDGSSDSHSASGEDQFDSFRRFCETRNGNNGNLNTTLTGSSEPAYSCLGVRLMEVAELGRSGVSSSGKMLGHPGASRESLSTVCSSQTGSTDQLPILQACRGERVSRNGTSAMLQTVSSILGPPPGLGAPIFKAPDLAETTPTTSASGGSHSEICEPQQPQPQATPAVQEEVNLQRGTIHQGEPQSQQQTLMGEHQSQQQTLIVIAALLFAVLLSLLMQVFMR